MEQSPLIEIPSEDKDGSWGSIDLRLEHGLVIVIPLFGPDHHVGADCWCHPEWDSDGVLIHNAFH